MTLSRLILAEDGTIAPERAAKPACHINKAVGRVAARAAIHDLTARERVHFALQLILEVEATDAIPALDYASRRLAEHRVVIGRQTRKAGALQPAPT